MSNHIGKKVRLTEQYITKCPHYVEGGKNEGTVTKSYASIWYVKMDNGSIANPFSPTHHTPQCEIIEEDPYIGKKIILLEPSYGFVPFYHRHCVVLGYGTPDKRTFTAKSTSIGNVYEPYIPGSGRQECIFADETHEEALDRLQLNVGDTVRILCKADSQTRGWGVKWVNKMDQNIRKTGVITEINPYGISGVGIKINDDTYVYPAYILEVVKRANQNTNNQKETNMNEAPKSGIITSKNKFLIKAIENINIQKETNMNEAPKSVVITSKNTFLIKAMWGDLQQLGYKLPKFCNGKLAWNWISHNDFNPINKEAYQTLWISLENTTAPTTTNIGVTFNLPEDYTKCLEYMTDAMKYWNEHDKNYKIGDWVTGINKNDGLGTLQIVDIAPDGWLCFKNKKLEYGWKGYNTHNPGGHLFREATPEEIKDATTIILKVGTKHTVVTVRPNHITARDKTIDIDALRNILEYMTKLKEQKFNWKITPTIDIAIDCRDAVHRVTTKEIQDIVNAYDQLSS